MNKHVAGFMIRTEMLAWSWVGWQLCQGSAFANPVGGTVAAGKAAISTTGSHLTVNVSSPTALINWNSFNIGVGETTTFVQPSSTSVVWNRINDVNPSQILGSLNANGYVILQNQSGFYVGGQASITAHGLLMTTSPTPAPDPSSGGTWAFNAPPPTAKIINYGQINIGGGGSAFLIAGDIENYGTISAPSGKIGLYDGQQVLVSMSPDGRGLSAQVTLPQGSVDNEGRLIADGGMIAAQAQTVNQNCLMQANSVQNINGVVELLADDNLSLGANSHIEAHGDNSTVNTSTSPGGSVSLQSGNTFSDQTGSAINVSGGNNGGNGGQVNICAPRFGSLQTTIYGQARSGYVNGLLTIDPLNIQLIGSGGTGTSTQYASGTVNPSEPPTSGTLILNVNSFANTLSQINLQAVNDIEVSTLWTLAGLSVPGNVTLTAGNDINFDNGAGIMAGNNWSVNLNAGNSINLNAMTAIQTQRGSPGTLSLVAGNAINVNQGSEIEADGGWISLKAPIVNQDGTIQANTVNNLNGVIEIDASTAIILGPDAILSAIGDPIASQPSSGGFVVLQGGAAFTDTASSVINVAAGTGGGGGVDGAVQVFGNNLTDATSIQSQIDGKSAAQFGIQDVLLVNPYDLTISANPTSTFSSPPTANSSSVPANLNISDLASYAQIDVHALDNIELQTGWTLNDPGTPATLSLSAGNNIILDDAASIGGGNNWSVNLTAGTGFRPTPAQLTPVSGSDGVYLNGSAFVQTQNGDITVQAANELQLDTSSGDIAGYDGIRTLNGGNITVDTQSGDVNAGGNPVGYDYLATAPYYSVNSAGLGGISTAAGGNVTINAGGNVYAYVPSGNSTLAAEDGGSGAFGPEAGNVTINAGGSVYGHFVLANGTGVITAGQNVGSANGNPFALSLVDGSWTVNAATGNIYLQEVRNSNGTFNNLTGSRRSPNQGEFLFGYAADASVTLDAGDGVELTDSGIPRLPNADVPALYPPILNIEAGAGGVTLNGNVTLFPSPDQNLNITTTGGGDLTAPAPASLSPPYELLMFDNAATRWLNANSFTDAALGDGTPVELNNPNPAIINISGSMENLNVIASKAMQITVGGGMINCGFSGQNLSASDVTSITVGGQIFNQSAYAFVTLPQAIPNLPADALPPGYGNSWNDIFTLALDPAIATLSIPANLKPSQWAAYAWQQENPFGVSYVQSTGQYIGNNPGFIYNAGTGQLGYAGQMSYAALSALSQPSVTVLRFGANGLPETYTSGGNTYFVTEQVSWAAPATIATLFAASQASSSYEDIQLGYRLGGPGQFDVTAGSISLGNSYGILSCGVYDPDGGFDRYENLVAETPAGATVNVTVAGELDMLTSTIATLGGGDVNVTSTGGSMDLGSAAFYDTSFSPSRQVGLGLYTAGLGDVSVIAEKDVDIDGSRIAAFDGGDIFVESLQGSVNVGSGISTPNGVFVSYVNPANGQADYYAEDAYGSGIVANTLQDPSQVPGSPGVPGNITVETPRGDITSTLGGIVQEALDGNISGGPTVSLTAGTAASGGSPEYIGNIDLGQSGVIGGTINLKATGNIKAGLVLSRGALNFYGQNVVINAISGGPISGSASGSLSGILASGGAVGVNAGGISADVLSQNASVNGGASKSTLGSSANATSTSQAAANQSNTQAKQQLANNDSDMDEDKKKKLPVIRHVKRVTVLLPGKS